MKFASGCLCVLTALAATSGPARAVPVSARHVDQTASGVPAGVSRPATGPAPADGVRLARDVFDEMNRLRMDPGGYVAVLEAYRARFRGDLMIRPGDISIQTREGVVAVDEAIRFLRLQPPLAPLRPDPALDLAARDHVEDQGPAGLVGHNGTDGRDLAARLARRGADPYGGENISYGYDTAREVVIQLLVDDGVAGRGHRVNLFRPGYARAGVGCGPHARFNFMCVIDYGYAPATPAR